VKELRSPQRAESKWTGPGKPESRNSLRKKGKGDRGQGVKAVKAVDRDNRSIETGEEPIVYLN